MKHREQKLATYVYNHCNICNIPIYFCNIHLKHLQRTSKTSETLERYACNMHFSPFFHATQSKVGNGLFRPPVVEDGGAAGCCQLRLCLACVRPVTPPLLVLCLGPAGTEAALATEQAHGTWRRRSRRRQPGPAATAVGGGG